MGRGWQPSMKKTAGSDILHKPGDASGMMEATLQRCKERERGRKREMRRFGGGGLRR